MKYGGVRSIKRGARHSPFSYLFVLKNLSVTLTYKRQCGIRETAHMPTAYPTITAEADRQEQKEKTVTAEVAIGWVQAVKRWFIARRATRRIWCVWRINNRVGLIQRKAFDKYSRRWWRTMIKNRTIFTCALGVHVHPPESEVIVLSREEFKGLPGLFMEYREFHVPKARTPLPEAYQRLFGCETPVAATVTCSGRHVLG